MTRVSSQEVRGTFVKLQDVFPAQSSIFKMLQGYKWHKLGYNGITEAWNAMELLKSGLPDHQNKATLKIMGKNVVSLEEVDVMTRFCRYFNVNFFETGVRTKYRNIT